METKILFFNVGVFVRDESFVCIGVLPVAKEGGKNTGFTLLELIELGRMSGFEPFPVDADSAGVVKALEKETKQFVVDTPSVQKMSLIRAHRADTHLREYMFDYQGGSWPMLFSACDIGRLYDSSHGFVFMQTLPNTPSK